MASEAESDSVAATSTRYDEDYSTGSSQAQALVVVIGGVGFCEV